MIRNLSVKGMNVLAIVGIYPFYLQIIHLIRDPRFQLKSRLEKKGTFKCDSSNISEYCKSVVEDIRLGSKLSPSLYRLVRYEDLTADPLAVMRDLYQFIGTNMTQKVSEKIEAHFHAENISRPTK